MKKIFMLCAIFLLGVSGTWVKAQNIVYHKGGTLYVSEKNTGTAARSLGEHVNVLKDELAPVTNRVYTIKHIDQQLTVEEGTRFYQGIQSPYDPGLWAFVIDDYIGERYSFWLYNSATDERSVLFTNEKGSPNTTQVFVPFEWTGEKDVIFLEAISDRGHRHDGIYTYNLKTGEHRLVKIPDHYTTTPILSPDKTTLLYTASFDRGAKRDLVDGISERIMTYDLRSQREQVFTEARGIAHFVSGWALTTITKNNVVDEDTYVRKQQEALEAPGVARVAAVSYKFPWPSALVHCTTRDGNVSSPGSPGSSSTCSDLGPHTYIGFDFDTPNDADEAVLAVAAGKVIQVNYDADGYGNYVRIRHDDETVSLYGHMKTVPVVRVGDCVAQGAKIGIEGTTGRSSGDHIHFEREVGGSNTFPTFSECGCTPHSGYNYTSANRRTDDYSCTSSCPASLNLTSAINSGTYQSSGTITATAALASGATVTFDATTAIVLNPGFSANYANGNAFTAKRGGCSTLAKTTGDFGVADITFKTVPVADKSEENSFTLYPNPAENEVIIEYSLQSPASIKMMIYNKKGKLKSEMNYGVQEPGTHQANVLLNDFESGIYFVHIKAGDQELTKKLIIKK